jgi:hypothetical protein
VTLHYMNRLDLDAEVATFNPPPPGHYRVGHRDCPNCGALFPVIDGIEAVSLDPDDYPSSVFRPVSVGPNAKAQGLAAPAAAVPGPATSFLATRGPHVFDWFYGALSLLLLALLLLPFGAILVTIARGVLSGL